MNGDAHLGVAGSIPRGEAAEANGDVDMDVEEAAGAVADADMEVDGEHSTCAISAVMMGIARLLVVRS